MSKENVLSLIVTLGALIVGVITLVWPTQAGTWAALITNTIIPAICAIIAAVWPVSAGVSKVYAARAKASYWAAIRSGAIKRPAAENADISAIMQEIYADLDSNGITYKDDQGNIDPVPVSPYLSKKLANIWNDPDVSISVKMLLLTAAINIGSKAFKNTTNLEAPASWDEVAAPQTYWLNHKVSCAIHSEGLFRQILMPLRTALKIRDTGNV